MSDRLPDGGFAALAPELSVTDLAASLSFWCDLIGFRVAYARPEAGFAYLEREAAQVMLEAVNGNWETGPLVRPFGRGINLQIAVTALDPILARLDAAGWPLFRPAHEAWYRVGDREAGLRQCLVQDPDGYLLRFAESLGLRTLDTDEDGRSHSRPHPEAPERSAGLEGPPGIARELEDPSRPAGAGTSG